MTSQYLTTTEIYTIGEHDEIGDVLLDAFGIKDASDWDYVDRRFVAQHFTAGLEQQLEPVYHDLAIAVRWLFKCHGNSSIDMSYDEAAEVMPVSWGSKPHSS